jgi:hypothetical protein
MPNPLEQVSEDTECRLSLDQQATLALLSCDEPAARVIGWHQPDEGPLIIRGDGRWQTILPNGRIRTKVSVVT